MIHQKMSATIGINTVFSESVFIGEAKKVMIEIQTFANGIVTATANIYANVALESTDTFRRVHDMGVYSASSGIYAWETPSGVGNFNAVCRPALGYQYLKIESSKTATAALTCYVHVIR